MINATKPRRWTVEEWLDYGHGLHRAKWRIMAAVWAAFPSKGLGVAVADHLIRTESVVDTALVAMEPVIFEHFGSDWSKAPQPMQAFPQHWFTAPETVRRDSGLRRMPLSPEERESVLSDLDAAMRLLAGCRVRFAGGCAGRERKRHIMRLDRAIRRLATAHLRIKVSHP